jgi:hypothetical protein
MREYPEGDPAAGAAYADHPSMDARRQAAACASTSEWLADELGPADGGRLHRRQDRLGPSGPSEAAGPLS